MGKQKSFIIVGSTFLGLFLVILIISLISSLSGQTTCRFLLDVNYIELGQTRGYAPEINSKGKIGELDFDYEIDKDGIIDIEMGTYAEGKNTVDCWIFTEPEKVTNTTIPYDTDDEISIIDGFWAINGEKTEAEAAENYDESEYDKHCSYEPTTIACWILNGQQTSIPYDKEKLPVRGENGNWFIEDEDTGYTYKGIQFTVVGKSYGTAKVTLTGKIGKNDITVSTNIVVARPDPTEITSNYIDRTVILKKGSNANLQYTVYGRDINNLRVEAEQDIEVTIDNNFVSYENGVITALNEGTSVLNLRVPDSSYIFAISKRINMRITVIVVDAEESVIEAIEETRQLIAAIGEVENTPETKSAIDAARAKYATLSDSYQKYVTNYKTLTDAETKYAGFSD